MSKEKIIRQISDDIADILIEESQQFKNTNNTMSLLACDIEKLYQQGRIDAIDEIKQKIDEKYYDGGYGDYYDVAMIVKMLEELKQQSN